MKSVFNILKSPGKTAGNWLAASILAFASLISALPVQGQPQAKIDSLLTMIQSGEKNTDKVDNLYSLAQQYYFLGNYDSAMQYGSNALDLGVELGYSTGTSDAFNMIGVLCRSQGNYEAALKNHMAALRIGQEANYKEGIGRSYNNIGTTQNLQGNHLEGLNNYMKALKIAIEIGDKSQAAGIYGNLGNTYFDQGNFEEALINQIKSLNVYDEIGNKRGASNALSNLGNIYESMGNYPEALNQYLTALRIKEEIFDKAGIADCYNNIAIIYARMNNIQEQLNNQHAALRIYEEIGSRRGISRSYNNIGTIYLDEGNLELALKYFRNSSEVSEEMGDKPSMANAHSNISIVYRKQGNYPEALKNSIIALQIRRETGENEQVSNSLLILGNIYRYLGNYQMARKCLDESLTLSKTVGNKREIISGYLLYSKLDSTEGNFAQALENYKMYVLYKDSLINEDSQRQISELQLQYETEKKDQEIELLNKDNEIKSLQLSKQKAIRHGMLAGIILLFITGFLLFRSFRLRKRLEQQQAIISERKRISADLHDDVGSGLSRIMLLTELVKNEAKTPEMKKEAEKIASISKDLSANISEIIWALNANNDYLESLVAYIRRYAAEFFDDSAVNIKITSTGGISGIPISGDLRREIFYTVKEALHNIYKHSQATEAKLGFAIKDEVLMIVIQDNGTGIPEKETGRYGNGLNNMQQRMEAVKGEIDIENHQGTKITLNVPVP